MLTRSLSVIYVTIFFLFSTESISSCYFYGVDNMYTTKAFTVPISLTLSVPPGIEKGQSIYKQNINLQNIRELFIKCDNPANYFYNYDYANTPLSVSAWSNKIYETGVPGIGIMFSTQNKDFPTLQLNNDCLNTTDCHYRYGWNAQSSFSLVKTADVVSAGIIYGNKLPTARYSLGQEGNLVDIYQISISGNINITVPTCDISLSSKNMIVRMGTHYRGDFSGVGSGTGWNDASIRLINCTQFFGNSSDGSSSATFNGTSSTYSLSPNRAEVRLNPLSGIEDGLNGIMKINDHPQKAKGIGIQLSTTTSENGKIDLNNAVLYALPQDGSSDVTLPLYARYIQTESQVKGGVANGRLEYTITYQ